MNRHKRILIICPFFRPNVGGVETRFTDICDELDKRGYTVTVLTYQPLITKAKGLPVEKNGNCTIYRFWWIGFDLFHRLKPYPALQVLYLCPWLLVRSFLYLCANHNTVDVVHTAGFGASLIGRLLRFFFRKRWVASTHAIYEFKQQSRLTRLIRWIMSGADVIMTLSEPARQEMIFIGIKEERLINQITWVNQDVFKPLDRGECRKKIKTKTKFVALFVGRLMEIKGVKVLASIAQETPFIDYVFIGDGPLKEFMEKKAKELDNVHFLSRFDNKDLPVYYNVADIFVMPSQYREGLGRVAVEALSCGLPLIYPAIGGMADILNESIAVLAGPEKESIKSAILELRNNPEKVKSMREGAREFALKSFSSKNADVITDAYG